MFGRLLLLSISLSSAVLAQNVTASITGTVKDATGAVVPNATVRATNTGTQTQFDGVSDGTGTYLLRNLPVGVYTVRIESKGFQGWESRDVRLQVNEIARIDASLNVGATTETVTVSSNNASISLQRRFRGWQCQSPPSHQTALSSEALAKASQTDAAQCAPTPTTGTSAGGGSGSPPAGDCFSQVQGAREMVQGAREMPPCLSAATAATTRHKSPRRCHSAATARESCGLQPPHGREC